MYWPWEFEWKQISIMLAVICCHGHEFSHVGTKLGQSYDLRELISPLWSWHNLNHLSIWFVRNSIYYMESIWTYWTLMQIMQLMQLLNYAINTYHSWIISFFRSFRLCTFSTAKFRCQGTRSSCILSSLYKNEKNKAYEYKRCFHV